MNEAPIGVYETRDNQTIPHVAKDQGYHGESLNKNGLINTRTAHTNIAVSRILLMKCSLGGPPKCRLYS